VALQLIINPPLTIKDATVQVVQTGGTANAADFNFNYFGGVTDSNVIQFAGKGTQWDEFARPG
jgi:hypothetical protein